MSDNIAGQLVSRLDLNSNPGHAVVDDNVLAGTY